MVDVVTVVTVPVAVRPDGRVKAVEVPIAVVMLSLVVVVAVVMGGGGCARLIKSQARQVTRAWGRMIRMDRSSAGGREQGRNEDRRHAGNTEPDGGFGASTAQHSTAAAAAQKASKKASRHDTAKATCETRQDQMIQGEARRDVM